MLTAEVYCFSSCSVARLALEGEERGAAVAHTQSQRQLERGGRARKMMAQQLL